MTSAATCSRTRELLGAGLVDDELVDPDLTVAADDLLEGADALPGVGEALLRHQARPAVEGAADLARIAADRGAMLVEDRLRSPISCTLPKRIPAIGVLGADPQHPRPVSA